MIVKLQWKPKKSTEAPFVVDVPDVFVEAFVIEKDSKRFPKSAGQMADATRGIAAEQNIRGFRPMSGAMSGCPNWKLCPCLLALD